VPRQQAALTGDAPGDRAVRVGPGAVTPVTADAAIGVPRG